MGDAKLIDSMIIDGLWDVYNNYHMGVTAENVARQFNIWRREQDEFAAASQQKAEAAQKAGRTPADLDLMEINEAFAAQAIGVNRQTGWDTAKINVNGGAIAIGHPLGASGCRVLVTLLHEMVRRDAHRGLANRCIGGGTVGADLM